MSEIEAPISGLADRVREHSETIHTEEAVKTSVVLPFLRALGYDVFNPSEVVPEFTADTYSRKGEKVDYAIQSNGKIVLLIECKGLNTQLSEKHLGQLFRYFSVTQSRFALLTNGREYRFYTDLDEPNKMDRRPFFVFDLLDHSSSALAELAKFSKAQFDEDVILERAERLKYVSSVKNLLREWMENPPENFVKLVASEVYDGRLNSQIRDMISGVSKAAFDEIVRDRMRSKLSPVFEESERAVSEPEQSSLPESEIVTTDEEIEGYLTVKALLRGKVESSRIFMRDAKTYCAILLDDNNRKPLARLHFNRKQKYVGFFDGEAEERVAIESLDDMLGYGERLAATTEKYE